MKRLTSRTVLIVYDAKYSGWVLEGVANDIYKYLPGSRKLLKFSGDHYFSYVRFYFNYFLKKETIFINQSTLRRTRLLPLFMKRKLIKIFYTHTNFSIDPLALKQLRNASKVVVMNSKERSKLIEFGLSPDKIFLQPLGIDFEYFRPLNLLDNNRIALVSQLHSRKRPDFIYKIIKSLPEIDFILIGKNWTGSKILEDLQKLLNFEYVEFDFADYNHNLNRARIFLSVSSLEGGPLPLLEAMACGLVPVVTDTGWASDLIVNHKNGIIIPVKANVDVVKNSIKKAYSIDNSLVRESVSKLTVESFVGIFRSTP